jgi:hypothetical protein
MPRKAKSKKPKREINRQVQKVKVIVNTGEYKTRNSKDIGTPRESYSPFHGSTHTTLYVPTTSPIFNTVSDKNGINEKPLVPEYVGGKWGDTVSVGDLNDRIKRLLNTKQPSTPYYSQKSTLSSSSSSSSSPSSHHPILPDHIDDPLKTRRRPDPRGLNEVISREYLPEEKMFFTDYMNSQIGHYTGKRRGRKPDIKNKKPFSKK